MRYKAAIVTVAAAVCTALLLVPERALSQLPTDKEAKAALKAKNIAKNFELNARPLTMYDRQGKVVSSVGPRGLYNQPVFSPDGKKVAVVQADPEKEASDLFVLDVATNAATRITSGKQREGSRSPAWSPDGSKVAYLALRDGNEGLYQKSSNGEGAEELIFQLPGGGIQLVDWTLDGRYLSYYSTQLGGSSLWVLPLSGERKPIEVARSKFQIQAARFSPDSRFVAYRSNETGVFEVYVQTFEPGADPTAPPKGKWKISDGGLGMVAWRRDGRELYYYAADRGIMAVEVSTAPAFEFGKPKLLFKAPSAMPVQGTPGGLASVSRDGQRFVFSVPQDPPLRQITMLDRAGKVVSRVGEPGLIGQPALSPDGTRVVVSKTDRDKGWNDLWAVDIATGKATQITNDQPGEGNPMWSPDGKHIFYVASRDNGQFVSIYRKAADGSGTEEIMFRFTPGAGFNFSDITADGKYATISTGALHTVPLTGADPLARKVIDFARDEFNNFGGRFSPDLRYMTYTSDETNRGELYVRRFDSATGTAIGEKVQITKDGSQGWNFWRPDGKELLYANVDPDAANILVMAMDVTTTPEFKAGAPKLLFKLATGPQGPNSPPAVSRDAQRFVLTMPVSAGAQP